MGMKLVMSVVLLVGLISCVDVSRSEKRDKIEQISKDLQRSNELFGAELMDSLDTAIALGKETKLAIKESFGDDTLSLERALQIDAYTRCIVEFEHIQQQIPFIQRNSKAIQNALTALKTDIEQEAGNRSKYDDQLKLEEEKVMTLQTKVDSILRVKNDGLKSFYELHNKLSEFSLKLVEKKEEEQ